jgi:hypothetical protein
MCRIKTVIKTAIGTGYPLHWATATFTVINS